MNTNLSKNQIQVLRTLAERPQNFSQLWGGQARARAWYAGLDALARRGLVERSHDRATNWRWRLTDKGRAALADEECDVEAKVCRCGDYWGEACHEHLDGDAVLVEYMPVHLRASHTAARNHGTYPHNGARRIRVTSSCAEAIIECDSEWAEVVGPKRLGAGT